MRADPRVAETQRLVSRWAPFLGLESEVFEIRWNDAARRELRARSLRGLMENRRILLDPEVFLPKENTGKFLLAHELAHLAQTRNSRSHATSVASIEAEADLAAFALLGEKKPKRIHSALRGGAAKKTDEDDVCYSLGNIVATSREREIKVIRNALKTGIFDWAVTDSDVDDVLRILQTMEFATASAVIGCLESAFQDKLLDNFSETHLKNYRTQVLAAYVGVRENLLAEYRDSLFRGMAWTGLTPEEHFATKRVIDQVRKLTKQADWMPKGSDAKTIGEILSQESSYNFAEAYQNESKDELAVQKKRDEAKALLKDKTSGVAQVIALAKRKLSYAWNDWAVTDDETLEVLDAIDPFVDDPVQMRAVAEGLEQEQLLDRFIDNLPVEKLYAEIGRKTGSASTINRRRTFLRLISYRDAYKNVKQAEELLQRGLFDWAVTDEDAFLAFQLIKVVPPRARAGFMARSVSGSETYASRLDTERSLSMKESLTSNFYRGGKEGEDLKSIQTQLLDDKLWTIEGMGQLGGLIPMAIAAGEHEWVFEQSRWRYLHQGPYRELYKDAVFSRDIIEKFSLYRPPGRRPDGTLDEGRTSFDEHVAEKLEGKPFGTDNFFWQYVIQGIDFFCHSKDPAVFYTTSIGGEGLDFGEFQDLFGGSFAGVRFKRVKESEFAKDDYLDNKVRWDTDRGILEMGAKVVDLGAINYLMDNFKFQSGAGNLQNLHVHMGYPRLKAQPTNLQLEIGSAVLHDLLLISTDSMTSIREIKLEGLCIELGSPSIKYENLPHPREKLDIPSVFGRAPFVPFIFGGTGGPPLMGWLGKFMQLGDYGSQLTGGLIAPETRTDLNLTCRSFTVRGITMSNGQYIESLELGKVSLKTTQPRDDYRAYLKGEKARLDHEIDEAKKQEGNASNPYQKYRDGRAETLIAQRDAVAKEIAFIDDAEKEQKRLQELQAGGGLSTYDKQKLDRLTHYLNDLNKGGVTLDIGSTKITGIAGKVTMGDVTLDDIHGHGSSGDATVGLLGVESLSRMLRGPGYKPVLLGHDEDAAFELGIKKIQLDQIDVPGAIPTVKDAQEGVDEAKVTLAKAPGDYGAMARVERAGRRLEAAKIYWDIASRVGKELSTEERDAFAKAKAYLLSEKSFHADSLTLDNATLGIYGAGGTTQVSLSAENLDAKNLEAAGFSTGRISGKGVWISADMKGGLGALADPRKNLSGAAIKADWLELSDVRHKNSGALFEKVTAVGLGAQMEKRGDKIRLGAKSITATGLGIAPTLGLMRKRLEFLEAKETKTADEAAKIKRLHELIDRTETYLKDLQDAHRDLDNAKNDEERSKAEHVIVMKQELIIGGLTQFGALGIDLRDFGVEIEGLGDILGDDFDLDAAIDRGLSLRGTGPDKQIWSGLDVSWASADVSGDQTATMAQAEKISAGALKGEIGYSSSKIALKNVELKSLLVEGMSFATTSAASQLSIWSDGATTLNGLHVDGTLEFRDTTEKEQAADPKKKRALSQVVLNEFRIDSLSANGFGLKTSDPRMEVSVKGGTITGLWAKDLQVGLPPDEKPITLSGQSGLEGSSGLDFAIILKKALGKSDKKDKAESTGLGFEFVGESGFTFTLGDLNVASGMFQGPDGWARFSLDKLKGTFKGKGDSMLFDDFSLGNLTLTGFHWSVGETGFVESKGKTQIIGAHLKAEILTKLEDKKKPTGAKPAPDEEAEKIRVIDKVKINQLRVDSILSDHLVYQDGSMKVEIKPPDKTAPEQSEMLGFKPFFIGNLVLQNLEWSKATGVSKGSLDLGKVEASGFFEDFKKGLKGGMALKATNMGASFFGKDYTAIDLGEIEKTGGFFKGKGVDTKFKTGKITGGVNLGKDFVEVTNLVVKDVGFAKTTYTAPGMTLGLQSGTIDAVELGSVRANFQKVTKDGKEKSEIKDITVENLSFTNIEAENLSYDGSSSEVNASGDKVTKTQSVKARDAWVQHLKVEKLSHDFASEVTELQASVDSLDPDASPFGAHGVVANLTTIVGSKKPITTLLSTDVKGGNIDANLKFKNVQLAPNRPWTSIEGTFSLSSLGLISPQLTYTDDEGKTTTINKSGSPFEKTGRVDLKGLKAQLMPNGTARVGIDSIRAKDLEVEKGDMKVKVPFAEISDFAAGLKGLGTEKGLELLAAKTRMLSVEGLQIDLSVTRGTSSAPPAGPASPKPPEPFKVQPLGGLGGKLDLEYDDLTGSPEITLPLQNGVIDFDSKDVSDPYYVVPLGVDDEGLYAEAPIYVSPCPPDSEGMCTEPPVSVYRKHIVPSQPGFKPGSGIGDRGKIDLQKMVEGLINAPADPKASSGPPTDLSALNHLDLWSDELRLGDGQIGTDSNHIILERSVKGDNTIVIPRNKVGTKLELQMPALRAKESKFKAPNLQGGELQGKTGTLLFLGVNVQIHGLVNTTFTITIAVDNAHIGNVEVGDVTFLDPTKLGGLPQPAPSEVKEVKPESPTP